MLNEKEIVNKLYEQADLFRHHMRRKDYLSAALCVDWAGMVALFVELDDDRKAELFGDRQPEEPVKGLIDEEQYLKACEWCIFHGYEISRHTYQNVQKMR